MKMVDVIGSLTLTNTGTGSSHTALLNGVALGSEMYQRVGRKINIKKIAIRCALAKVAANAVVADTFRFALVWDEQPNGALPTFSDIWLTVDSAGATAGGILAHANTNNTSRFRILRSHQITVDVYTASAPEDQKQNTQWEWNVPMNTITQFNAGGTAALGDIATGALYMVGHGGASAANAPFIVQLSSRVKYLD